MYIDIKAVKLYDPKGTSTKNFFEVQRLKNSKQCIQSYAKICLTYIKYYRQVQSGTYIFIFELLNLFFFFLLQI